MLDPLIVQRMEAVKGEGPIIVALSGGGDSVALLHLLSEKYGGGCLRAAVVDHKLREGSAADAQKAAGIAASQGVSALVLDVHWEDGANRAHEAARRARYAALCEAARKHAARVIVMGHTRDDQAETVFLRASRGSGMRGLAGMRGFVPAPIWPEGRGLWLARPLLGARRAELRKELTARGAAWIEDPANENEIYARVRARRRLAELEQEGLDPMRFAVLAERLQPYVEEIDRRAAGIISDAASFDDDVIILDRARWRGEDAVKQRALDALIIAASGEQRGASPAQLESLDAALDRADFTGATLAGAWLQPRSARVIIRRDPGALTGRAGGAAALPPLPLSPGREVVWDGRLAVTVPERGWAIVVEEGKPVLAKGEARAPLARERRWLLRDRVNHVLSAT